MYKILHVRRKPKTRSSNKTKSRGVVYLPESWQGKRVYVLEEKCLNRLIVLNNKLKRKINSAKNILEIV